MGNFRSSNKENYQSSEETTEAIMSQTFKPVDEFEFQGPFEVDSNNGLILNGTYFPEEVLSKILGFVPPKQLLSACLVCKIWCNIVKSDSFWIDIYNTEFPHKAKRLPWYVYYLYYTTDSFKNMLKNGNGQKEFSHWQTIKNFGDQFKIENPPVGCEPLPEGVPDFNGYKSCFVTSYYECVKLQDIDLENKRLLRYIMNKFSPHIYVSEWVNGRWDCSCKYTLYFKGYDRLEKVDLPEGESSGSEYEDGNPLFSIQQHIEIEKTKGREWEKVSMVLDEYPKHISLLVFEHEGIDSQFWKGHYGSKMAGGVVKLLFDSIKPLKENTDLEMSL